MACAASDVCQPSERASARQMLLTFAAAATKTSACEIYLYTILIFIILFDDMALYKLKYRI